jgi:hypothetical protein
MKKLLFLLLLFFTASICVGQNSSSPTQLQKMILSQMQVIGKDAPPWIYLQQHPMQQDEKFLMKYLYAYMPLSDLITYSPAFFDANVKQTLETKHEMDWGAKIPEDIFLHFVLPLRVNNEPLDSFRLVMYPELKERVQGLSMEAAALEINHWCHEKVSYRGTDSRTSSPMSLMLRAFGRCGEESTFTVAALRTVGIPARQVYTPRWAHTDDNHAWVEVWIDGKWNYMGACEPEPCLNRAWFTEPAKRAVFIHAYTYGPDADDSSAIRTTDRFSELNLTARYAPVKPIVIEVTDTLGYPVDSAKVECRLYNYAEFYPILKTGTNAKGKALVTLGKGDLLIWTVKNHLFGFKKLDVRTTDTLVVTLSENALSATSFSYDMIPPSVITVPDTLSTNLKNENNEHLRSEDSIRHAYIATFKDAAWAKDFANRYFLSVDTVRELIEQSYGNWPQVKTYLSQNAFVAPTYLLALASQLSEKDLSDLDASTMTDHLLCATKIENRDPGVSEDNFIRYVLSPRISTENITPWRSFLINHFGLDMARDCRQDILPLIHWIATNIRINRTANQPSNLLISPEDVYTYHVSDIPSRDLFFVAACRSFGIPSRLNPTTNKPEYLKNDQWYGINFQTQRYFSPVQGKVKLVNCKNAIIPQYGQQFTIAQLHHGGYHTLTFEDNKKITDFPDPLLLDTGNYVLTTGNRLPDDKVLSSLTFFTIKQGDDSRLSVTLRQDTRILHPLGKINLEQLQVQLPNETTTHSLTSLITHKKEIAIILLDPEQEPSRHVLNDLAALSDRFQNHKIFFIFVITPSKIHQAEVLSSYSLPMPNLIVVDQRGEITKALHEQFTQTTDFKLPIVILCDKEGTLFFKSSGYTIGIGNQLLNVQEQLCKENISKEDKDICAPK